MRRFLEIRAMAGVDRVWRFFSGQAQVFFRNRVAG